MVILFREDYDTLEEKEIASKYFNLVSLRSLVPENSTVIARYSALPFYKELEQDLATKNSRLINSFEQHCWIADFLWYEALKEYTPTSWPEYEIATVEYNGPFILKGRTNSRKHQWRTHMYAENKCKAIDVASNLVNDPLIGPQGIIYREYVPLKRIDTCPIYGTPFVNEWRLFYYKTNLLTHGFYWTNAQNQDRAEITSDAFELANKCAQIASEHTNFFVLDIAQKENGDWILIEINDGQMSGLSNCNANELYSNLKRAINVR